jgi:hypothetical protein
LLIKAISFQNKGNPGCQWSPAEKKVVTSLKHAVKTRNSLSGKKRGKGSNGETDFVKELQQMLSSGG